MLSFLGFSTFSTRTLYPLECCGGSKSSLVGAQLSEPPHLLAPKHSLIIDLVDLIILTFFSGIRYGQSFPSLESDYLIASLVRFQHYIIVTAADIFLSDSHTLMAVPELYRYGREGTWFGIRIFMIYVLDGIVQVR